MCRSLCDPDDGLLVVGRDPCPAGRQSEGTGTVVALSAALQEGLYELDDGAHTEGNYTFIYGEIRVEASLTLYDARIQQLVLTAWPVQGGSCIERYHLIRKADGY